MSSSTADQPSLIVEEISLQSVYSHKGFCGKLMSYSSLHRSIVTVYVSPEQYPFYLHKGRLCQLSSFFEKAFYGSFEEATTGSVYLEEDGVDEFKLFEEWVYSKTLSYPKSSDDPSLLFIRCSVLRRKLESRIFRTLRLMLSVTELQGNKSLVQLQILPAEYLRNHKFFSRLPSSQPSTSKRT